MYYYFRFVPALVFICLNFVLIHQPSDLKVLRQIQSADNLHRQGDLIGDFYTFYKLYHGMYHILKEWKQVVCFLHWVMSI